MQAADENSSVRMTCAQAADRSDAEANAGKTVPVSEEEKKKNAQQSLFASAMKDYNDNIQWRNYKRFISKKYR
jgi:hypothetical protein